MKWGCFCYCSPVDEDKEQPSVIKVSNSTKEHQWEVYSLKELLQATNNFHEDHKIGEGGFGSVYWGRTSKGDEIAVKRLKAVTMKAEMEFAVEVEILGRVRHKNLLGLRGFYVGADVLLDWPRRMNIVLGSAEGLVYLHHEANPHIIHRDIKASNVLLDAKFEAKVADFGFAKLIPEGVSHVTTRVKGTLGYLAPEYAMWGKVSESCDVYSFGILLLEIISGKKPLEKLPGGIKRDIIQWVTPYVEKANYNDIVDPRLKGNFNKEELKNAVEIALRCTAKPEKRPSMIEVVDRLKNGIISTHKKEVMQVKDCLDVSEDQYTIEDYEDEEEDEDTDYERFQSRAKRNWDELKIRY
ncbi:PTI1-like tyrosine-protein kinase At3g15890 isoform X2 [Papaver somniferum]|uniref:PTI1-like tyrosine-protein kinase At3g15890 isoform X2 n=1 Tax=Papaver somniferum TaxID=3469 RepID=UPI000E6F5E38|nr:PTI1-like tyrosine-protein kinase At3g15890 isoform X2 [Papaver somniferum]